MRPSHAIINSLMHFRHRDFLLGGTFYRAPRVWAECARRAIIKKRLKHRQLASRPFGTERSAEVVYITPPLVVSLKEKK